VKDKYEKISIANIKEGSEYFIGQEMQIDVVDIDNNIIKSGITYSAIISDQAEITQDGKIRFTKPGYLTIKVSSGINIYDYKKVKISSLVKGIKLDNKNVYMEEIGDTFTLKSSLINSREDTSPILDGVTWTSSNSSIVSVSNGLLKANGYGSVRISVTSKDGLHVDYGSVTVKSNDDYINDINNYIRSMKIQIPKEIYGIGEEIPISISYLPSEAKFNKLTFETTRGDNSQFINRNGDYYFKPHSAGKYRISVKTESEIEKFIEFEVINNLKSIELDHNMAEFEDHRFNIYYGEEIDFRVIFNKIDGEINYDKEYILSSLNNKVEFKNISDDMFTVIAKNTGYETITIKSKYSGRQQFVNIKINQLTSKIEIEDVQKAKIGESFTPTVNFDVLSNDRGITEPFNKNYTVEIESIHIPEKYIEDEIKYEKDAIKELTAIKSLSTNGNVVFEKEISLREDRKRRFEMALKNIRNGYVQISKNSLLTDRVGKQIRVASISNNSIVGLFEGYITYKVRSFDGNKIDKSNIYFNSDISDFIIKSSNKIISSTEKSIETDIDLKLQKEISDKINLRFSSSIGFDIPSENYIISIIELESKIKMEDKLKRDYNRVVSKEEFYRLMIDIIKSKSDYTTKKVYSSVYLDDNSGLYNESYNLGLLSRTKDRMIYPNQSIDFYEFRNTVIKLKKVIDVKKSSEYVNEDFYKIIEKSNSYDDLLQGESKFENQILLEELIDIINRLFS
ncbi:MAG: Ig-like domain-containing protein, partial [Acidaminobacteraceae bacterium]